MSARVGLLLPNQARDPRSGAGGAAPDVDRAWQREMEKAQTQQWFHGAVPQGERTATASLRPGPPEATAGFGAAGLPASGSPTLPSTPGLQFAAALPDRLGGPAMRPQASVAALRTLAAPRALATNLTQPAGSPAPNLVQVEPAVHPAPDSMHVPALRGGAQPATALAPELSGQEPIRMHVEESSSGLQVWFGIAGDASQVSVRSQALLDQLRRECAASGQRLARVVCNGEILFSLPLHQEP